VIGYLSGQDGAILPARDTGYDLQGTFIMLWCFIPYNKSFIDQACSVKMAGYWPHSFFCVFMDLDFVSVHKHSKKELGQYPAILTSRLVNNPYILIVLLFFFYLRLLDLQVKHLITQHLIVQRQGQKGLPQRDFPIH